MKAQDEIAQSLIENNMLAAQLWLKDAVELAKSGNLEAQAVVDLSNTEDGKRALWELTSHIDLALASCAFQLPSDDESSHQALLGLVKAYPETKWVVEQHLVDLPLDEVNEDLVDAAELIEANTRLARWFAV